MQTPGNSAAQVSAAANSNPHTKLEFGEISATGETADVDATYLSLSKQFIRKHLLMRTVTWIFWMLVTGVAFAATTVWLLFPR